MTDVTDTSITAGMTGPVHLTVPPVASMSRVVRLTASALASLAGATLDEIDDVKLAASELLIVLIEHGRGDPIDLQFELVDARDALGGADGGQLIVVQGEAAAETLDAEHPDLVLCRTVLESVCATSDLQVVDGLARIVAGVRLSRIE